jgi:hypothetical protein
MNPGHETGRLNSYKVPFNNASSKPKLLIRNKIGSENYINDICMKNFYSDEGDMGRLLYVNIVDYLHIFIKTMNKHINICMQDDSIEIEYDNPNFKTITSNRHDTARILSNTFSISSSSNLDYLDTTILNARVYQETKQYFLSKVTGDTRLVFNSIK